MSQEREPRPDRSVGREVGRKDERRFSSFSDLAKWAVEMGHIGTIEEAYEPGAAWGDLLFTWYKQGQLACVFAQALARSPEVAGWFSALVEGDWSAETVTEMVDVAAEQDLQGIQLLFPSDNTADDALSIISRLVEHPRWECVEIDWLEGESGDSVQVGLRWFPPEMNYESWALGIACFNPMAFTRRFEGAPFIAIVVRPTPPVDDRAEPKTGHSGLPAAHLAHMDDGLGSDGAKRERWTKATSQAKRALVSPAPLSRARARVTFSFPSWARTELEGCFKSRG